MTEMERTRILQAELGYETNKKGTEILSSFPDIPFRALTAREIRKASESEFMPLVRKDFLKIGDIIALKHKFSALGAVIEKDALVSLSFFSNLLT